MKSAASSSPVVQPLTGARAHRGTVLAVDDRPRNLELLQATLGGEGYEVIPANSGEQALECVAAKIPDVILLDVMMPGMDGFEVCRRLKHDARTADIAVIFLSAAGDKPSIVRGIESGGVDYVTKPFTKEELLARVHTHVSLKHLLDRNRNLLQSRQQLLKQELEDLKRPLRTIATKLGEISRTLAPPPPHVERLLEESVSMVNSALRHISRDLSSIADINYERSIDYPVSSQQLHELIGQWYLSARRRTLHFKMTRLAYDVQIACHLSPLRYLIDSLISSAINLSKAGDYLHLSMRLHEDRLQAWIEQSNRGESQPSSQDAGQDVRWVGAKGQDLQLVREAERQNCTLQFGVRPDGGHVIVLALPLDQESSGTL